MDIISSCYKIKLVTSSNIWYLEVYILKKSGLYTPIYVLFCIVMSFRIYVTIIVFCWRQGNVEELLVVLLHDCYIDMIIIRGGGALSRIFF